MHDQFDVFVSVVEMGSFSTAAKKLHKSPSAVSKQMAALEQAHATQFFDRTTRSLNLTEAGKIYYAHCKEMQHRIRNVSKELDSLAGNPAGEIRITWPAGLAYSRAAEALGEFAKQYTEVRFDIVATNDVVNIKEEGIDIAFRTSPKESSDLVGIELFEVRPMVCASPDFIDRHGPLKQLSDLAEVPNILPSYMNLVQKMRPSFPELAQLKFEEQHRASDIAAMLNLCRNGLGAALLLEHIVERELQSGELVNVFPDLPVPNLPVYMIHHRLQHTPQRLRVFIDFFKRYFLYPDEVTGIDRCD